MNNNIIIATSMNLMTKSIQANADAFHVNIIYIQFISEHFNQQ
jgi:hypothetical protein